MIPGLQADHEVTLTGPYALGILPDGSFAPSTHLWRDDVLTQTLASTPANCKLAAEWSGVTISLVNIWSHNYFHWMLENLTQLVSVLEQPIDHFVVPKDAPRYVRESLALLGEKLQANVVEWQGQPVLCHRLVSFGPVRWNGKTDSGALQKLRSAYRDYPGVGVPKRIYISRANASSRRVTNEQALIEMLLKNGFMVFHLENFSFLSQAKCFSNAEIIIAPHGAGLTNMVWAKPGCQIIEFTGSYMNPCFYWLAQALDHKHVLVECAPKGIDMLADLYIVKGLLQ